MSKKNTQNQSNKKKKFSQCPQKIRPLQFRQSLQESFVYYVHRHSSTKTIIKFIWKFINLYREKTNMDERCEKHVSDKNKTKLSL